jgi:hypothetical protein
MLHASTVALSVLVLSVLGACTDDGADSTSEDTTAPTIVATAKVVGGEVVLSAAVSDNVGVTQVEFKIDDTYSATLTDSRGPNTFSTSVAALLISKGGHRLTARAADAAGNATLAEPVTFQIGEASGDRSPIKITATAVKNGINVTFIVDIESPAQIDLSNFFLDGAFLGGRGDDQRHYELPVVLSAGEHRFVVDVTDVDNHSTQAEVVVEI